MSMVNQDKVAAQWKSRGFSCDLWVDPPGQEWLDYVHEVDELVMVVEGEVEFEFHNKRFRPRPGEELLIPRGVRHSVRNLGSETSCWLYGYRSGIG